MRLIGEKGREILRGKGSPMKELNLKLLIDFPHTSTQLGPKEFEAVFIKQIRQLIQVFRH